jgi:hypothetical protein
MSTSTHRQRNAAAARRAKQDQASITVRLGSGEVKGVIEILAARDGVSASEWIKQAALRRVRDAVTELNKRSIDNGCTEEEAETTSGFGCQALQDHNPVGQAAASRRRLAGPEVAAVQVETDL